MTNKNKNIITNWSDASIVDRAKFIYIVIAFICVESLIFSILIFDLSFSEIPPIVQIPVWILALGGIPVVYTFKWIKGDDERSPISWKFYVGLFLFFVLMAIILLYVLVIK